MVTVPVLHAGPSRRAQAAEWAISGERWTLNGVVTDVWGIRVASGSQNQALTDNLLASMPDYAAHGVNAIALFYQGSRGLFSDPFQNPSGDTVEIDSAHQARVDQIIDKAEELGMLVILGLFYQNLPQNEYNLGSIEQVRNALRLVTDLVEDRSNVVIDVCNEQNHSNWFNFEGVTNWDWNDTARVIEACQIIHTRNPDQIVGGGGYDVPNNTTLVGSSDLDCLLFDMSGGWEHNTEDVVVNDYEPNWNTPKPLLNIELFGGITRLESEGGGTLDGIGDFIDDGTDRRLVYYTETDRAAGLTSTGSFFHASNWTQVVGDGTGSDIHFELGTPGEGTAANPGIRWWFEYVRDNT